MDTDNGITLRMAVPGDASALLSIYAPYVRDTAITFEYEAPGIDDFAARIAHTLIRYPYIVAQAGGRIVGYAYAGPFKSRAAYDWAVETTVYIDENERGRGVGRLLYGALERVLQYQGILNMNACVAWSDAPDEYLTQHSVRFHEHMGFVRAGQFHRCGCKFGRWYDIMWLEKAIGEHKSDPQPVLPIGDIDRGTLKACRIDTDLD